MSWGPVGGAAMLRPWMERLGHEMRSRPTERVALVQLAGDGSPHETAVAAVLGAAARPATLSEEEVEALAAGPPALRVERLRDVVRFDGLDALWAALVTERGIPEALDPDRREALEWALRRWIAADGTLRIPVEAALLSGPG
ncbi:MAG TPA: hypothetical protein VF112_05190 [Candidatus Dormibacteraeota bacterium]